MQIEKIRKSKDFKRISKKSKKLHSKSFLVLFTPNENIHTLKFGITVTKKVGNAVVRNRCKRRVRAIFTEIAKQVNINANELIVIVKPTLVEEDFGNLKSEAYNLITKFK